MALYQCHTYSGTRHTQAGSSRDKQGESTNQQGNLGKQDTIVSTDFSCPATVDLIKTRENGPVPPKNG